MDNSEFMERIHKDIQENLKPCIGLPMGEDAQALIENKVEEVLDKETNSKRGVGYDFTIGQIGCDGNLGRVTVQIETITPHELREIDPSKPIIDRNGE